MAGVKRLGGERNCLIAVYVSCIKHINGLDSAALYILINQYFWEEFNYGIFKSLASKTRSDVDIKVNLPFRADSWKLKLREA